eukprot:gene7624-9380_t
MVGQEREFWFIYRQTKDPQYYAYLDDQSTDLYSSFDNKRTLNQNTSPLYRTIQQMELPQFGYMIYSEQYDFPGSNKVSKEDGHSKGFIIFNSKGEGIHVPHSLPQFPNIDTATHKLPGNWIPDGGKIENQNFFCYYFHDISVFTTYMARNRVAIQKYKLLTPFSVVSPYTGNPKFDAIKITLDDINTPAKKDKVYDDINTACINSWNNCVKQFDVDIPPLGPMAFFTKTTITSAAMETRRTIRQSFSRDDNTEGGVVTTVSGVIKTIGYDVWVNIPHKYQGRAFWVFTSLKKGNIFPHTQDNGVIDVYSLDHREMIRGAADPSYFKVNIGERKLGNVSPQTANDHSKIAFPLDPDFESGEKNDTIFCVGDVNRQTAQHLRGGGVICFSSPILVSYFTRAVSYLINPRITADTAKYNKNDRRAFYVYLSTAIEIEIPDRQGNYKPALNERFEVFDRYYTPRLGRFLNMSKSPRRYYLTGITTPVRINLMAMRNVQATNEPNWLPTKQFRSENLVNVRYIPSDDQVLFCNSTAKKCKTMEDASTCPLELSIPKKDELYPIVEPHDYEAPSDIRRIFKLVGCPELKSKYHFVDLFKHWGTTELYDKTKPVKVLLQTGGAKGGSELDITTPDGPYIRLSDKDYPSHDLISHLLTQYIIFTSRSISTSNFTDPIHIQRFMGLTTAVSKLIFQDLFNPTVNSIDEYLRAYLDRVLNGVVDPLYDLELPDVDSMFTPNPLRYFYRFASGVWDLIDERDDSKNGNSKYKDFNHGETITINNLLKNLKVEHITSITKFRLYIISLSSPTAQNLNANPIAIQQPAPLLNDQIQTFSTTTTKEILINDAGFNPTIVNSLSDSQLELIQNSLDQWITINGSSASIYSFFKDYATDWNTYQPIFYLQQTEMERNPTYSTSLCSNLTVDDSPDVPYHFVVCNPLTIVDLTNAIQSQIDQISVPSSLAPIVIGDLTIYYFAATDAIPNFPLQSGITIATLNSKICDIQLAQLSEFNDKSIVNRICTRSGPIIDSVDILSGQTTGNYPITINGAHFISSNVISIGSNVNGCTSTTFVSSNQLICNVAPNTGFDQSITINSVTSPYNSYQHELIFNFNFNKPNVIELTKLKTQSLDQTLLIKGNGFGINAQDIVIQVGTESLSMSAVVTSVTDNQIEFDVEWSWAQSFTQTLYPGDLLPLDQLIFSPLDQVLVGDMVCEANNATSCFVPQGFSKDSISVQNQYSAGQSPSFVQFDTPIFTGIASNHVGGGKVVQLFGNGLSTTEDIDFFKVGTTDITSGCQSFNNWVSCILPPTLTGSDLPITMSVEGVPVIYGPGFTPTITIFAPVIQTIEIQESWNQTTIEIMGSGFAPSYADTVLKVTYTNGSVSMIPIQCESTVLCTWKMNYTSSEFEQAVKQLQLQYDAGTIISNIYTIDDTDSISGLVFIDANRDSLYTPSTQADQVVANVTLILTDINGNQKQWTTGQDGSYKFRYIKQGVYILTFRDIVNRRIEINTSGQPELAMVVISKIQLNTSTSTVSVVYNLPLQRALISTPQQFVNCTGQISSGPNNTMNFQYGKTMINALNWCDTSGGVTCPYPFTSFVIDQDYCNFYVLEDNYPKYILEVFFISSIHFKLIDDPYFTGITEPTTPVSTQVKFNLVDFNSVITVDIVEHTSIRLDVPYGNINISFVPTASGKASAVNNIQVSITKFQTYQLRAHFYDGNQTVATFYDVTATILSLPVSVITQTYLSAIGWVDRVQMFETSAQYAIYLFSQDNINSVITLPGINGQVVTTGINKRIEISYAQILDRPVKGLGELIRLDRANDIQIYVNGIHLQYTKIDSIITEFNLPSSFGKNKVTFTWRSQPFYNELILDYNRQYQIDSTTPTSLYLDNLDPNNNKVDTMYHLWTDDNYGLYNELVVNYTGIYLSCGTVGSQYIRAEIFTPNSQLSPSIQYSLLFKPDSLCIVGKTDNTEYYCHAFDVTGIRYLQMVKYGYIYQNDRGDIVKADFCRYSMPQQYPSNKRIHPLALSTPYLDSQDPTRNTLQQGEFITNGIQYGFLENNGLFVIYGSRDKAITYYTSNYVLSFPTPLPPYKMVMQTNGNLCVYGAGDFVYWCTDSQGLGGRYFLLSPIDILSRKYEMMIVNNLGDMVAGKFEFGNNYLYNRVPYLIPGTSLFDTHSPQSTYQRTAINVGEFITNGRDYLIVNGTGVYLLNANPYSITTPSTIWSKTFANTLYLHILNSRTMEVVGTDGTLAFLSVSSNAHYFNVPLPGSSSSGDWGLLLMGLNQQILNGYLSLPQPNLWNNYITKNDFTTPQPLVQITNMYLATQITNSKSIDAFINTNFHRLWGLTDMATIPNPDPSCATCPNTEPDYKIIWDSTFTNPVMSFNSRNCTSSCDTYSEYYRLPPPTGSGYTIIQFFVLPSGIPEFIALNSVGDIIWNANIINGQNSYLHAVFYDTSTSCGTALRQQSFHVGRCYAFGNTQSSMAVLTGTQVTYSVYATKTCSGTATQVRYNLNVCSQGTGSTAGYFIWRSNTASAPILPSPGKIYYERYYSGCTDNVAWVTRVAMLNNQCLTYGNEVRTRTMARSGTATTISMAPTDTRSCILSGIYSFQTFSMACAANTYQIYNAYMAPAPIAITMAYKFTAYGTVEFSSVSGGWNLNSMLYKISYLNPSNSQYTDLCMVTGSGQGCISTGLANGMVTRFQATLLGVDYLGGTIPAPYITPVFTTPSPPTITGIIVTTYTTKSVTFSYTSINGLPGSPLVYSIKVDNIERSSCSSATTCSATGLTPGSTVPISISVTSAGATSPVSTITQKLYNSVSIASFTTSQTPTSITAVYTSSGGVPSQTTYTVTMNGTTVSQCNSITSTSCTMTNLIPYETYVIQVSASNDGSSSLSSAQRLLLFNPVKKPVLSASPKTQSVDLSFTAADGYPGATTYNVFNGGVAVPNCQGISTTTCKVSSLSPETSYTFRVDAVNSGVTASESISSTTYKSVSSPTLSFISATFTQIDVSYGSLDGVPSSTLYTIQVNDVNVDGCTLISNTICTIGDLDPGSTYQIVMVATNDGTSVSTPAITSSTFATPAILNLLVTHYTTSKITFSYESTGGITGHPTSFNVKVNGVDIPSCSSTTTCTVTELIPGSNIPIEVTSTNFGFTSPVTTISQLLYPSVFISSFTTTQTPTTITATYASSGGVPTEGTIYTVFLNGTAYPDCTSILETMCTIPGLTTYQAYDIQISATNDETTVESSKKSLILFNPVTNVLVDAVPKTKSVELTFSSTDGYPGSTIYNIFNNDIAVPNCQGLTSTICTVSSLLSNTQYNFRVDAVNSGDTSSASISSTTIPVISSPTLTFTSATYTEITISFGSSNGLPGQTLYTIQLNGVDIEGCTLISDTVCTIESLTQGIVYDIGMSATNDETTISSLITSSTYSHPTIGSLDITGFSTTTVSFSYSANGGVLNQPTTFNVLVNGVAIPSCSSTTTCTVEDLPAGEIIPISVSATNFLVTSEEVTVSQDLADSITVPSLQISLGPTPTNSLTLDFSSLGGSGTILYTISINGTNIPDCTEITTNQCIANLLTPLETYNFTVMATNDGFIESRSQTFFFWDTIQAPTLTATILTRSMTLQFPSIGGNPALTQYSVQVDGLPVTDCQNITLTTCLLPILNSNTEYNVVVTASNFGLYPSTSQIFKTYDIISDPILTITSISYTEVRVTYQTSNGVPGLTLYTTELNGIPFPDCLEIKDTTCLIHSLTSGSSYNISVFASNDLDSVTTPITPVSTYIYPVMGSLTIIDYTTQMVRFNYTSSGGHIDVQNSYHIVVDGNIVTSCSTLTDCTVQGLQPGKDIIVQVSAINSGYTSNPISANQILYATLSTPTLDVFSVTTTTVSVQFSSINGVPDNTKYSVYYDSTVFCDQISTTNCIITGLNPGQKYTISVNAINDINTTSNSTLITTFTKINNPMIKEIEITTDLIKIQVSVSGGIPDSTSSKIYFNNQEFESCTNKLECTIDGLDASTSYSLAVQFQNDGDLLTLEKNLTTYSKISVPQLTSSQTATELIVSSTVEGGVPTFPTTFDIIVNGTIQCTNISTSDKCTIPSITYSINYDIDIYAYNYKSSTHSNHLVATYPPPSGITISSKSQISNITLSWTSSQNGKPDQTKYTASISYDGSNWIDICTQMKNDNNLECLFNRLAPNVYYMFRVTVFNSVFDPVQTYSNQSTLDTPSVCIDRSSSSNTTCSGQGSCFNGQCRCNNGFDGTYCEEKINQNELISVDPEPSHPITNITKGEVKSSLEISSISEVDPSGTIIKSIQLSKGLQWTYIQTLTNQTVSNPSTNEQFYKNEWTYSTTFDGTVGFSISFVQFTKISQGNDLQQFYFASQNYTIKSGSLKYTIKINGWKFSNQFNSLKIESIVSKPISSSEEGCVKSGYSVIQPNPDADITNINIRDDKGNLIVGKLINRAILDTIPRSIKQVITDDAQSNSDFKQVIITSIIPHFQNNAIIDPDFNLVRSFDVDCSKKSSSNWRMITGVTIGVVAFVGIGVASAILIKKKIIDQKSKISSSRIKMATRIN